MEANENDPIYEMKDIEIYKTFGFLRPNVEHGKDFDAKTYFTQLFRWWLGFDNLNAEQYAENVCKHGYNTPERIYDFLQVVTKKELEEMIFDINDRKKLMKIITAHQIVSKQRNEAAMKNLIDKGILKPFNNSTPSSACYATKPHPDGVGVQWTVWLEGSPHHKKSLLTSTPTNSCVKLRSAPSKAHVKAILQRCQKYGVPLTFQEQN